MTKYLVICNFAILQSIFKSKFSIYSINTKDEIERIKDLYKYVNFIETDDIYDNDGKSMIKLNAILNAIKKIVTKYFTL